MAEQDNQGGGCIAVGIFLLILLGLGWLLLPRLLFGFRRQYNARLEARHYVGAMGRGQQAYYVAQGEFASAVAPLELGLKTETEHYLYQTQMLGEFAAQSSGMAKGERLHHVIGLVWQVEGTGETSSQLCESDQPTDTALVPPPPLLVRVLNWFRPDAPSDIPPGVVPVFEVPTSPVAPEVRIPCPPGYSAL